MKKRKFRKLHQIKKKKSIFKNRFFWLGIFTFLFLGSLGYFLFFSETFQIKKIIIADLEKVSKEEINSLIEKKIVTKIFFFESKSIFLINSREIRENVLNNFPQIGEVRIKKKLPDTLSILPTERVGLAYWKEGERYFLIDGEGVIFEEIFELKSEILQIKSEDLKSVILGEKVVDKETINQILEVEEKLKKDLEIEVEEFLIVSGERWNVKNSEGWEIFLNPQEGIKWQLTKLKSVLEEEIPTEKRQNIEYIELRFGNLAPVKYKD